MSQEAHQKPVVANNGARPAQLNHFFNLLIRHWALGHLDLFAELLLVFLVLSQVVVLVVATLKVLNEIAAPAMDGEVVATDCRDKIVDINDLPGKVSPLLLDVERCHHVRFAVLLPFLFLCGSELADSSTKQGTSFDACELSVLGEHI